MRPNGPAVSVVADAAGGGVFFARNDRWQKLFLYSGIVLRAKNMRPR